ncbi:MAG: hypothetical protein LBO70_04420 [Clostridiales Family XIII bacterium]|jgi:hypothetical protein|nr:hypothetical protein [Clostridiales Family XIII bacterium]
MTISDAQTKKLLEYDGPIQLKQLAMNFALNRFKTKYVANPSDEVVTAYTKELNTFFDKYESIMKDDYEWITSL